MKKKILLFVLSMVCLAALLGGLFVANADETPETIIAAMYEEYDAPIGVIAADVERILNILRGIGALEE